MSVVHAEDIDANMGGSLAIIRLRGKRMSDTITESQGDEIIWLLKRLVKEMEEFNRELYDIKGKLGSLRSIEFELEQLNSR